MAGVRRVLHIVESLDKGAVENWLVSIFLRARQLGPEMEWSFFCTLPIEGRLESNVKAAGGIVIRSSYPLANKLRFLHGLRKTLREQKYDIVHMHHDYMSGFYMIATFGLGLKSRIIVHTHNNDRIIPVGKRWLSSVLVRLFRVICLWNADDIVGISRATLNDFLDRETVGSVRTSVLYYGIDMHKFRIPYDRDQFLLKYGMDSKVKVLLFVGRMNREKNPYYAFQVVKALLERRRDFVAFFVGEGEFKGIIGSEAESEGLSDFVRLVGWSDDVVEYMSCADVFLFPRLEVNLEGLGLVVVESQCVGLPMITTSAVVDDAIIIPELVTRIGLEDIGQWLDIVEETLDNGKRVEAAEAYSLMLNSPFELDRATLNLLSLYNVNSY